MPRLLLLIPTTTYRTEAFVDAANGLGVEVVVASDRPNALQHALPDGLLTLDFSKPDLAARKVAEFARRHPIDGVVPVDDADHGGRGGYRQEGGAVVKFCRVCLCRPEQVGHAGTPAPGGRAEPALLARLA